jgi:hypothetical protein
VLGNVAFTAWLAARRSAQTARAGQEQVAAALRSSRVSLSLPVLEALAQLTGSQFVVWDPAAGTRGLATLPREAISDGRLAAALPDGTVDVGGQRHRLGVIRSGGVRPETVIVLTPVRTILAATLETVWPVLAVAAATLAALVPLGWRLTGWPPASAPSSGMSAGSRRGTSATACTRSGTAAAIPTTRSAGW